MPLRLNSLQEQLEATSTDLGRSGFDLGFLSPPKGLCEWETLNSWLLALSLSRPLLASFLRQRSCVTDIPETFCVWVSDTWGVVEWGVMTVQEV